MVMQRLRDSTPDSFVVLDDRGGLLGWVPYTFLPLDREPPSETVFLRLTIDEG